VLPGEGGVATLATGAESSWWRPVNAGWNGPRFGGAIPLAQAPGDSVGAAPLRLSLRIRALKTLLEEGEAPSPPEAKVHRAAEGYVVELPGDLDPPSNAALHAPEGWWTLAPDEDGGWRTVGAPTPDAPPAWTPPVESSQPPWLSLPDASPRRPDAPGAAIGFPHAKLRAGLLERRVERGGWCVVLLEWPDAAARRSLAGSSGAMERRVVRVAAPIGSDHVEGSP
jgi:hypothetical protein